MKKTINDNERNEEAGVKQLTKLIKLAGDEARATNKRVVKILSDRLRATGCHLK